MAVDNSKMKLKFWMSQKMKENFGYMRYENNKKLYLKHGIINFSRFTQYFGFFFLFFS